jgi:ABC-2 type transport system permease protein
MFRRGFDYLRLIAAYTKANLRAQLEYPGAFLSQVVAMFVNDGVWVLFWMFFFGRFPLPNGWQLSDVILLWTIPAAGFGMAYAVMGNAFRLAPVILNGELDVWLSHPRSVLPHMLLGRSVPSAWGDAAFGCVAYLVLARPDLAHVALFLVMALASAIGFVAFGIAAGSLSFFLGSATSLAEEWRNVTIMFGTYPPVLFQGAVKMILFSAIPAGLVSYLPVEAVRTFSMVNAGVALLGVLVLLAVSTAVFHCGLRRYESGNLMTTNG